jgi:hypothetical protein
MFCDCQRRFFNRGVCDCFLAEDKKEKSNKSDDTEESEDIEESEETEDTEDFNSTERSSFIGLDSDSAFDKKTTRLDGFV